MTNAPKHLLAKPSIQIHAAWGLAVILGICWINATQLSITEPILKSEQQRTVKYTKAEPNRQGKLALCLGDWDASSHMSKGEWRRACERTVSLYPTAFR
jgi:hypothetical protein